MEIALSKESKRKSPVAVAFRDGERTFGSEALATGVKYPKACYMNFLDLLGKKTDHELVQAFSRKFPYYTIVPCLGRDTVCFKHDEQTTYSVEELVAMILSHSTSSWIGCVKLFCVTNKPSRVAPSMPKKEVTSGNIA